MGDRAAASVVVFLCGRRAAECARKRLSMTLLFYAAFQVFSTFAIWQHVFAVQDYYIDVFDKRVDLTNWTRGSGGDRLSVPLKRSPGLAFPPT